MAIEDEAQIVTFTGNASTSTAYVIPFVFRDKADLIVTRIDAAGVRTVLELGSDYTVTGQNLVTGGGAIPATDDLEVDRDTPLAQDLDSIAPSGAYKKAVEGRLDRIVMAQQDAAASSTRNLSRTLRVPRGETLAELAAAADRAGYYVGFDDDGALILKSAATILAESGGAATGVGLPSGGLTGQQLFKASASLADATWGWQTFLPIVGPGIDYTGATDSTDAIEALWALAEAAGVYHSCFRSGTLKVTKLTQPSRMIVVGTGTDLRGDAVPSGIGTKLLAGDAAQPVVYFPTANGQHLGRVHIEGGTFGIDVGDGVTYGGNALTFSNIRIHASGTGFRARYLVGVHAEHVHANYCGWGYELGGVGLPLDTSSFEQCGANYYTAGGIKAGNTRNVTWKHFEGGNGTGPALKCEGGYQNLVFDNCNWEAITNTHLFEITYQFVEFRSCKIDVAGVTSFIRQTVGDGKVVLTNPFWLGATYIWEGVTGMRPPHITGDEVDSAVFRYSPDNTFGSTTKTLTYGEYKRPGAHAYSTANQALTTGVATPIICNVELKDTNACHSTVTGLYTADRPGWYQAKANITILEANANSTRLVEWINGGQGSKVGNPLTNHGTFAPLSGSAVRWLETGHTYTLAVIQDSGGTRNIYAGDGTHTSVSIIRLGP